MQNEWIGRERERLWKFIRKRIPSDADAEDILQDVFSELIEAYSLLKPIEQAGAWMFQVARNRIIDFFRRKTPEAIDEMIADEADGPDRTFEQATLAQRLADALDELPEEQRFVFLANEVDGRTFKDISEETGVGISTLLSRKRYAVLQLRKRLQNTFDEMD